MRVSDADGELTKPAVAGGRAGSKGVLHLWERDFLMPVLLYCILSKNRGFLNVSDNWRERSRATSRGRWTPRARKERVNLGAGAAPFFFGRTRF